MMRRSQRCRLCPQRTTRAEHVDSVLHLPGQFWSAWFCMDWTFCKLGSASARAMALETLYPVGLASALACWNLARMYKIVLCADVKSFVYCELK